MTTAVGLKGPQDAARNLVATAFPALGPVPVAVSTRFANELGAHRGSRLTLTVGTTPVPISVTEVLSTIPSAPGAVAVLANLDSLSRALVVSGDLEFPVDAWWVGRPTRADAAERATALRLGTVTTRAAETARLTGGPLHAALPAALRLLVPAAVLLLFAGVVLPGEPPMLGLCALSAGQAFSEYAARRGGERATETLEALGGDRDHLPLVVAHLALDESYFETAP